MHTPIGVTNEALAKAKELDVDVVVRFFSLCTASRFDFCAKDSPTAFALPQVAVGGGSTIGLGKAIALHSAESAKIRQIVIPTTCTPPFPRLLHSRIHRDHRMRL